MCTYIMAVCASCTNVCVRDYACVYVVYINVKNKNNYYYREKPFQDFFLYLERWDYLYIITNIF